MVCRVLSLMLLNFISLEAVKDPFSVYDQIKDLRHPTVEEYQLIQKHLTTRSEGMIQPLGDSYVDQNLANLQILSSGTPLFESDVVAVNCSPDEKENCLITYCTYNKDFPAKVKRLVQHVANSDFKGHILYRIGGWPNVEGGDLFLSHIPYAFKVCAFREAKRLGYKRVFWLDSPAIPNISLNDVFNEIEAKGYYAMGTSMMIGPYFNEKAATYFDLKLEETYQIPSCAAGIFGVDFTNQKASRLIDLWYQAACEHQGYQSMRPEQNALSILLYKLGLREFVPDHMMLVYFNWLR